MYGNYRGKYSVSNESVSVTDATQFFQLVGGTGAVAEVIEIRVWQTGATTLDQMNAIHIVRGTGGAGGTVQTEDEYNIDGPAAIFAAADGAPSAEVTTVDLNIRVGWNFLQEMVWLPTPDAHIYLKQNDDMALALVISDTLTVGYTVTWVEFDV